MITPKTDSPVIFTPTKRRESTCTSSGFAGRPVAPCRLSGASMNHPRSRNGLLSRVRLAGERPRRRPSSAREIGPWMSTSRASSRADALTSAWCSAIGEPSHVCFILTRSGGIEPTSRALDAWIHRVDNLLISVVEITHATPPRAPPPPQRWHERRPRLPSRPAPRHRVLGRRPRRAGRDRARGARHGVAPPAGLRRPRPAGAAHAHPAGVDRLARHPRPRRAPRRPPLLDEARRRVDRRRRGVDHRHRHRDGCRGRPRGHRSPSR